MSLYRNALVKFVGRSIKCGGVGLNLVSANRVIK